MNGASKILTVSYGTFSCTLEGFDEPFNTMKAIAEYFRDLAADDRYFGAEPPTPDAAMLHKIAEREIQRRVEAKVSDNGVLLRADDAPMPRVTMPAAPTLASEAAAAVESAAARLSRLRAAHAQILAPAPALGDISSRFRDIEAYFEDQDAPKPVPETVLPEPAKAPEPPAAVAGPVAAPPMPAQPPAETTTTQTPLAAEPEAAAPPDADILPAVAETTPEAAAPPAADIPSAVAETPFPEETAAAEPADQADMTAAELTAKSFPEDEEGVLTALRETLAGMMGQDDQLAADMAEAEGATVTNLNVASDDTLVEDQPSDADEAAFEDRLAALEPARPADLSAADADLADLARLDGDTRDEPEVDLQPHAPVVAEKLQRARARVIKIRRLDKRPDAALLTPEAEADLQNTLAALAAEINPDLDATVEARLDAQLATFEPAPEYAPEPAPADKPETKIAATDDAAVDRLLAQTNTQLEVPEVKRRRSAIAHLKAAVLATVADRRHNPDAATKGTEVKMDPYRKDLDQAVRPSAPADRPAPLVLVSAQRIDRKRDAAADALRPVPQIVPSVPAPQQPVRPRRVTTGGLTHVMTSGPSDDLDDDRLTPGAMDNIFAGSDKQSFAEFAESLGAENLAELIEAAGAYCTLVLDRPSFSRPLLFQQMSTLPQLTEMSREDGLRGFGKLLRDGRIQKTERGQFALSSTSPILTEAKRIAS